MKKIYSLISFILFLSVVAVYAQINNIPHYYTLQIIEPVAGLDTKNRFYKAYPGLDYNVKMGVIGGAFPFTYALTVKPTGMTIDQNTGIIDWPNPITTGSPFSITATVTDQLNNSATVSWTIAVQTSGFLFVDGANGHNSACNVTTPGTATGTISDPLKGVPDWYCGTVATASKHDSTYANYFVYYRGGATGQTYQTTAPNGSCMQFDSDPAGSSGFGSKPMVHMAYPGENVNIDVSVGCWAADQFSDNLYYDRLNFINPAAPSYHSLFAHNGHHVVIRRSSFSGTPASSCQTCNQAAIEFDEPDTGYVFDRHLSELSFSNIGSGYAILIYAYAPGLIEYSTFDSFTSPYGNTYAIGLKGAPRNWFVRGDTFTNFAGAAVHILYACGNVAGSNCVSGSGYTNDTRDIEASFDYYNSPSGFFLDANADCYNEGGPIYVFRNTVVGGRISINCPVTGTGPFYIYNNILQNQSPGDHVECSGVAGGCPGTVVRSNNAYATSGLVDASGNLSSLSPCGNLPNACSSYVGVIGKQTGTPQAAPPKAPLTFQIVPGP